MDGLGNPTKIALTEGQVHDVTQAPQMLAGATDTTVLADKGYDCNSLIEQIESQGSRAVIPSRRHALREARRDLCGDGAARVCPRVARVTTGRMGHLRKLRSQETERKARQFFEQGGRQPGSDEPCRCRTIELQRRAVPFKRETAISVVYEGVEVGAHRLDLFVGGLIVVELKAIKRLEDVHFAVVRSYLRAMGMDHGLLMNFAAPTLQVKRVIASAGPQQGIPGFLRSLEVSSGTE